jgi:hypothetical protein
MTSLKTPCHPHVLSFRSKVAIFAIKIAAHKLKSAIAHLLCLSLTRVAAPAVRCGGGVVGAAPHGEAMRGSYLPHPSSSRPCSYVPTIPQRLTTLPLSAPTTSVLHLALQLFHSIAFAAGSISCICFRPEPAQNFDFGGSFSGHYASKTCLDVVAMSRDGSFLWNATKVRSSVHVHAAEVCWYFPVAPFLHQLPISISPSQRS